MFNLDAYFIKSIAEHDGIKPEEVTRDYLHEQNKKKFNSKRRLCGEVIEAHTSLIMDSLDSILRVSFYEKLFYRLKGLIA